MRSLAIRLTIGSPDARIDVHWLRRQQELLGDARFDALLRTQLDELWETDSYFRRSSLF